MANQPVEMLLAPAKFVCAKHVDAALQKQVIALVAKPAIAKPAAKTMTTAALSGVAVHFVLVLKKKKVLYENLWVG